jgi:cytochrome P450
MTRQRDDQGSARSGGRSGNDYLVRGGEGYESWGAEGPSGATAEGGYPGAVPALADTAAWRGAASERGSAARESDRGSSGVVSLLLAAGVGAALMYFLDGARGAERRRQVAEGLKGAARSGQRAAQGAVEQVRSRLPGTDGRSAELQRTVAGSATVASDASEVSDMGSAIDLP